MIVMIGFKEKAPSIEEVEVSILECFVPNVVEAADERYGEGMWRLGFIDEKKPAKSAMRVKAVCPGFCITLRRAKRASPIGPARRTLGACC